MKLVLIVGAAGGIGSATCQIFAKEGFNVIATDVDMMALKNFVNEKLFNDGKQKHNAIYLNVRDLQSIERAFEYAYQTYGESPSIMVNTVGIAIQSTLLNMSEEDFTKVIDINLNGGYRLTKIAVNYMLKCSNSANKCILHVSSVANKYPFLENTNYGASKAGLTAFIKVVGKELAEHNIRVISIAPGMVDTNMNNMTAEEKALYAESVPMKRLAHPDEIGDLIYYLASSKCAYVTASDIEIGGGFSC